MKPSRPNADSAKPNENRERNAARVDHGLQQSPIAAPRVGDAVRISVPRDGKTGPQMLHRDLPASEAEYRERYMTSLRMLNELRGKGIAAGVYTQTTDVEGEINGLMTYDRKVIKFPANQLAELHELLFTETPQKAAKADQPTKEACGEGPTDPE